MADAKTKKQKVKEITDKLEEGLKELFESEKYKNYLSTMSKFHNYSVSNTLLIALQKPDATLVAGYFKAWQTNFNRHVNKREKGIRILAPVPYKIKEERDKLDPVTGEIMLDKDGMPQTEEVEAESIAYTVCQHFGIDTSDYSFGYIAGWSSGKDMRGLKSSLDTIRKTASELMMGIEGQLMELQRDREIMQDMSINGQEKESLLLIQKQDLSEHSLLSEKGMETAEIVEALSGINEDDRLNAAAYLESMGAWTTEIANQDTKEFGEYHLDVRYNIDTNEVTDLKAEMAVNEKAKEPIGADDVILKITHADGFEVERITNKTPEEVQEIMAALAKLEEKGIKSVHRCLENYDADYIPIIVSGGRNDRFSYRQWGAIRYSGRRADGEAAAAYRAYAGNFYVGAGLCSRS